MKRIVLLIMSLSLVACAGPKTMVLDKAASPLLKGKSLAIVGQEQPSFVAMTSGKGMFAVAGVGAAVAAGNELVEKSNIKDPAPEVAAEVAKTLNSKFGLVVKGSQSRLAPSGDLEDIVAVANDSNYALAVETIGWSFIYDGFNFSDYLVGYNVKLRLVDVTASAVISAGNCNYNTKDAGKPLVTYETLVENDAAYIKQALSDAKTSCVAKFRTELF